ncbi:MAG: HEAT repeat domain-containing protein [bacterium]|nr:HEAT repeat domain-containing protein [bacterium]
MSYRPQSPPWPARLRLACALALLASGCSSWRSVAANERWTLYENPGSEVSVEAYEAAFEPAFDAIARSLGPFENRVDVHAWHGSVSMDGTERAMVLEGGEEGVQHVPGIGPARIQAYHARGGVGPFARSGVFIGVPDPGTAVHELVHARLSEENVELPLWFEEGLATLLGDGLLHERVWVQDGLACWPLRELREEALGPRQIERLLAIQASDHSSVRDNVLVHFLGWAIVFDLHRETGSVDWRVLIGRFDHDHPVRDATRRLERTLSPDAVAEWLERLHDPDPGTRLAAAKGTWKLRSRRALATLLEALEEEQNSEVRVGMAVNLLAAAGEIQISWRQWRRVEQSVRRALREANLANAQEQRAALDLYRAYRHGGEQERAQLALKRLSRFWEE